MVRLFLQNYSKNTAICYKPKFYFAYNINQRISSYQKDCNNLTQLDITYSKNSYNFNMVNYAFMLKRIMILNLNKERNSHSLIENILQGSQETLETESQIETSEIYARSLANVFNYSFKILNGMSEKYRNEIKGNKFLEFCEKKIKNDFIKFNNQELAITIVILEKRKNYELMADIANHLVTRFDELELKSLVIIFQAYVKSNLRWQILFQNIIDTLYKKVKQLDDLSDQDFSDVLYCICKETFLNSEEYIEKKKVILDRIFGIVKKRINKQKYREVAKILSCFTYIIKKYEIPINLLQLVEKRILIEKECQNNREICNCLIFFCEIKYDSKQLFDSMYKNLMENNKLYSITDIETIQYCLSGMDSEYKKPLQDVILNYFYANYESLIQKIRGTNYEKIFMGLSKNKSLNEQDQELYSKLITVIQESLKQNLKTNFNRFTTSNLGALCAYIHPITKSIFGSDKLKQEIYSEIFVNLVDIEKESNRQKNFTLKSLKEIIDTLCKYFDRIEEDFVKKVFTNWVFKILEVTLADNIRKNSYNEHTLEEQSVILFNLNRLYGIDKHDDVYNKNSQAVANQAQNFIINYKEFLGVGENQKIQVKKTNFETIERYFKNHSKNTSFCEENFRIDNTSWDFTVQS